MLVAISSCARSPDVPAKSDAWRMVPKHKKHTDHSAFFREPFTSGPDVTRTCLKCHQQAAQEVMQTAHWNWEGEEVTIPGHEQSMRIGKRNVINNFCIGIQSNWPACTSCHIGYGWEDESFDFTDPSRIDCLICHASAERYAKKEVGAGLPDESVDLLEAARSVGIPRRSNCGACHFYSGGGAAIKHGDLDDTLLFPSERIDVHMGKFDFHCVDCHRAKNHHIPGRSMTVSVDNKNRVRCVDCHAEKPHQDVRLNLHTERVVCQTCHIPYVALEMPTKLTWDWSQAGQDLPIEDEHVYLKIKGRFTFGRGIKPEYYWYNENSTRYILGDRIDPAIPTRITSPLGDRSDDSKAKIWPFKIHRGKQIYDKVNRYFIVPHVHGEDGFWSKFDWATAARVGSEVTGLTYSGEYDFAPTEMFLPLSHMVAKKDKALACRDCHGDRGRLDWRGLGYSSDPLGRKTFQHMPILLRDGSHQSVAQSAEPLSTTATCGMCHNFDDAKFKTTHAYHKDVRLEVLAPQRRWLLQHGPKLPSGPDQQMNCFLCHITHPDHRLRQEALRFEQPEWSLAATLAGLGLVSGSKGSFTWSDEIGQTASIWLPISHVSEANCGVCHGLVDDGARPLAVILGNGELWSTETTGQIFSPQRIAESAMNLKGKDSLRLPWDVHAERLISCGDCHYSTGRPERLTGHVGSESAKPFSGRLRRCESCHSITGTHDWLPDPERHFKAVACEACHVPILHMAARQMVDATVVRADGAPQSFYRGVREDAVSVGPNTFIRGYQPLLVTAKNIEGRDKIMPYNLIGRWYWTQGNGDSPIAVGDLRRAWLGERRYKQDILELFDANKDGRLNDHELRLDSDAKVTLIASNLKALGITNPRIKGELRGYHIHHNIRHEGWASGDCNRCHGKADEIRRRFPVAPYIPGGVIPAWVETGRTPLDGQLQFNGEVALDYILRDTVVESYRKHLVSKEKQ